MQGFRFGVTVILPYDLSALFVSRWGWGATVSCPEAAIRNSNDWWILSGSDRKVCDQLSDL